MTHGPGTGGKLWPIRYKPLPDELLSSWLVRLAHGHGLKVQTFCNLIFGNRRQVWNRDVDRLAPSWLVETLAERTGTPLEVAQRTTLRVFEGTLFKQFHSSGTLTWVQTMRMYHRKRQGFAQQFCPVCLRRDATPYFRKTWRVALKTFCVQHECKLLDRCHACGSSVAFHRVDMAQSGRLGKVSISHCHRCEMELGCGPRGRPLVLDKEAFGILTQIIAALDAVSAGQRTPLEHNTLAVMRHLTIMMLSRRRKLRLGDYLTDRFGEAPLQIAQPSRPSVETQCQETRHMLLLWSAWLLCAPQERLGLALGEGAFRYNHLLRDFVRPPEWYVKLAQGCPVSRKPGAQKDP